MGVAAVGAGLFFGLAMVLLATFFRTRDERYDRIAEWSFIAFGVLGVPTVLAVSGRFPAGNGLVAAATVAGVAGAGATGLGELALVLRLVDFRRLAGALAVAFLAFLVWIGLVSVAAVGGSGLSSALGWLGVVSIAVGMALVLAILARPGVMTGAAEPPTGAMVAFFVPMAGIVGWMVWLGTSL